MIRAILRFLAGAGATAIVVGLASLLVFALMQLGMALGAWLGIPFEWRPLIGLGLMLGGLCIGIGVAFALDEPEPGDRP